MDTAETCTVNTASTATIIHRVHITENSPTFIVLMAAFLLILDDIMTD